MLDIKDLRSNLADIKTRLAKRQKAYDLDQIIHLDTQHREALQKIEELKAQQNAKTKEIPVLKKNGQDTTALMTELKALSDHITTLEPTSRDLETQIRDLLLAIPNPLSDLTPEGADEADNIQIRTHLAPTAFSFIPKAHHELGLELDILDFERGAKVTGSRFTFYKGLGARLERALINLMMNTHTDNHGYTELHTPVIVNRTSLTGTGQLPKFEEDVFKLADWDYFLAPTAEVPVTNFHGNEILEGNSLPLSYVAYSNCFRAEAGSAGRDIKGVIRQHQFAKVELVKFTKPEDSYAQLEQLLGHAEQILKLLGLPYRVVQLCGGDTGFASAYTYDIEVWMPSYGRYVEISSCSNFESFQARRAGIRFKDSPKDKAQFVHTLNGSGLAIGRTFAAIIENFQQADGSIKIPEALIPYMGTHEIK